MPVGSAISIAITTATNTWLNVSIVSTQMLPLRRRRVQRGHHEERDRAH